MPTTTGNLGIAARLEMRLHSAELCRAALADAAHLSSGYFQNLAMGGLTSYGKMMVDLGHFYRKPTE
jgi:hypothetical protein